MNAAAPTSAHRWEQVCLDFLRAELAPSATRWRDALRLTLLCTIATTIILAFQIPFGEFLIIFFFAVCQPDAWASFRKARWRFVGTLIGGGLALLVMATCGDKPGLFIFLQAVIFAIGLFLSRTTTIPYVFLLGTMTFVIATPAVMNDPDSSISKVIWRVVLTSVGTAIGTMAQLILWPEHPEKLLLAQLKRRLERAELILDRIASGGAMSEPISPVTAMAGQLDLLKSAEAGSQWLQQRHTEQVKLICDVEMILLAARRLEHLVAANPAEFSNESAAVRLRVIRRQVAEVRRALEERRLPTPYTAPPAAENAVSPLQSALADLDRVLAHLPAAMGFLELAHIEWKHGRHVLDPVREPIATKNVIKPDCRLSNTEVVRFALKSSLAATICYVIYQALDWPGISTCVVTAIICAQSSFGAGLRKSLMRILGASLGGIASLAFAAILLPNIEDAGWFIIGMSLLFFLASWLNVGSSRVSYVGMQIGLAMALVLVNQPHGQVELKAAGDRVLGVLLGIFVMGFVDLTIWPNFAGVSLPRKIRETVRALAMLPRSAARQDWDKLSATSLSAHGQIAGMLALYEESRMEFGSPATASSTEQHRVLTLINGLQEVFLALLVVLRHHRTMHHEALPKAWQEHVLAVDEAIAQSLEALADSPGEPVARMAVQKLSTLLETLPAIPAEAETPGTRAQVAEYALVCRELAESLQRAVARHEKN